jgi:hypothetical protein
MMNEPQYDSYGRMRYHPDYHPNHKKPWMTGDEKFLIENYVSMGPEATSLALGRTIHVTMTRVYILRKAGKMPKRQKGLPKHRRVRSNAHA